MEFKKLWIALALVLIISFAVLGGVGYKTISNAPPIPSQVVSADGQLLFDGNAIRTGQNVWQSIGGQEIGTVWGHGAYVAPDWSADYLHRECVFILDHWAQQDGAASYAALSVEKRAALQARLQQMMRTNTYDAATGQITVTPITAAAFHELSDYYFDVFNKGRNAYAIQPNAINDRARGDQMTAFFWWTAWAAGTDRPGTNVTYTQNWPHEELIGNRPTGGAIVWSVISFVLLLGTACRQRWRLVRPALAPLTPTHAIGEELLPRLALCAYLPEHLLIQTEISRSRTASIIVWRNTRRRFLLVWLRVWSWANRRRRRSPRIRQITAVFRQFAVLSG